jgi:hypothetical protein
LRPGVAAQSFRIVVFQLAQWSPSVALICRPGDQAAVRQCDLASHNRCVWGRGVGPAPTRWWTAGLWVPGHMRCRPRPGRMSLRQILRCRPGPERLPGPAREDGRPPHHCLRQRACRRLATGHARTLRPELHKKRARVCWRRRWPGRPGAASRRRWAAADGGGCLSRRGRARGGRRTTKWERPSPGRPSGLSPD